MRRSAAGAFQKAVIPRPLSLLARVYPASFIGDLLDAHKRNSQRQCSFPATDVVPVEGHAWDTDPFKATVIGDKLYRRGSADMKGYIATALVMAPQFLANKADALTRPRIKQPRRSS